MISIFDDFSMKLATVIGTRPEIITMAELIPFLDKNYDHSLIYTGQHFSQNMKGVFFDELSVRNPDYNLGTNSSDYCELIQTIQPCLEELKPSHVIVYGDTNSTAAAIAAKKAGAEIIHLEAGLRSFDPNMAEEKNRVFVDKISKYLLTPTQLTEHFLLAEGYKNSEVTGNPVVGVLLNNLSRAIESKMKEALELDDYLLATLHRQENVDNQQILGKFVGYLGNLDEEVVFPIHPRTRKNLKENNIELPKNVKTVDPLGFFEFVNLMYNASLILTDSGGVQEEAITLKKPCVTLRDSTERWETIFAGANILFPLSETPAYKEISDVMARSGTEYYKINGHSSLKKVVESMLSKNGKITNVKNPYGDEYVSQRIMESIREIFEAEETILKEKIEIRK